MTGSTGCVIVLTTWPSDSDAAALARMLVEEQLAACVGVLSPMQSVYRWEGSVEEAEERQLIIKTTAERVQELKSRLLALHTYDVPEILVLPIVDGSHAYLAWLQSAVAR